MPRLKTLMRFEGPTASNPYRARWVKMHAGQRYSVYCKRLGWPETEAGSASLANSWWQQTLCELTGQQRPQVSRDEIDQRVATVITKVINRKAARQAVTEVLGADEAAQVLAPPRKRRSDGAIATVIKAECDRQQVVNEVLSAKRCARNLGYYQTWLTKHNYVDGADMCDAAITGYHLDLQQQINDGKITLGGAKDRLQSACYLAKLLASKGLCPLPPVILLKKSHLRLSGRKAPRKIDAKPDNWCGNMATLKDLMSQMTSERCKLFVLLALNLGWRQTDIATLQPDEVSWKDGTSFTLANGQIIKLPAGYVCNWRHKTQKTVIPRKLWPETWALLQAYGNRSGDVVLTNNEGKVLVNEVVDYDGVGNPWREYLKRKKVNRRLRLPFQAFRKTGASLIGNQKAWREMRHLYLGNLPTNVNDSHYVEMHYETLAQATDWLRSQVLDS